MTKKKVSKRAKKQKTDFAATMEYGDDGLAVSIFKDIDKFSSMSPDFDSGGVYCDINGDECQISWDELRDATGLINGSAAPTEYFDLYVDEDGEIQAYR